MWRALLILSCIAVIPVVLGKKSTDEPTSCRITDQNAADECQDFAREGSKANYECQVALKGVETFLKICTMASGLKEGDSQKTPVPKHSSCKKVSCKHPCYVPCVYFIARNRTFKADPAKEFKFKNEQTYVCKNKAGESICGCAFTASPFDK